MPPETPLDGDGHASGDLEHDDVHREHRQCGARTTPGHAARIALTSPPFAGGVNARR